MRIEQIMKTTVILEQELETVENAANLSNKRCSAAMAVYRDTFRGDAKDLNERVRQLTGQLDDRKQAAIMLQAENQRLKRSVYDLQTRLADIEAGRATQRGESEALGALRWAVLDAKKQHADKAADYGVLLEANHQLVDDFNELAREHRIALSDLAMVGQQLQEEHTSLEAERKAKMLMTTNVEAMQMQRLEMQQQLDRAIASRAVSEQAAAQLQAVVDKAGKAGSKQQATEVAKQAQDSTLQHMQVLQGKERELQQAHSRILQLESLGQPLPADWDVSEGLLLPPTSATGFSQQLPPAAAARGTAVEGSQSQELLATERSCASGAAGTSGIKLLGDNSVELTFWDATFNAEAATAGSWGLLLLHLPGRIPRLLPMGLGAAALQLHKLYRLYFTTGTTAALAILQGSLGLSLHRADRAIMGIFPCALGYGGCAGEVQLVVAIAVEYSACCFGVLLYAMDQHGLPMSPFLELSTDWHRVLPEGQLLPAADEFIVDMRAVHPLQLESCRQSGVFLVVGRTFTGTDGQLYQVWRPGPAQRRLATGVVSGRQAPLHVCDDPLPGATAVAHTSLTFSGMLDTATSARRELDVARSVLRGDAGSSPTQLYEPLDANGLHLLQLATSEGLIVGTVRVGLRLHHEMDLRPLLPDLIVAASSLEQQPQLSQQRQQGRLPMAASAPAVLPASFFTTEPTNIGFEPAAAVATVPPAPVVDAASATMRASHSARSSASGLAERGGASAVVPVALSAMPSPPRSLSQLPVFRASPALSCNPSIASGQLEPARPPLSHQLSQRGGLPVFGAPPAAVAAARDCTDATSVSSDQRWERGVNHTVEGGLTTWALLSRADDSDSDLGSTVSVRSSLLPGAAR